jgi:hypothetical protein
MLDALQPAPDDEVANFAIESVATNTYVGKRNCMLAFFAFLMTVDLAGIDTVMTNHNLMKDALLIGVAEC